MPLADRPLPTRQAHLDFHTSEHIPDIGRQFSKEQWQGALKARRAARTHRDLFERAVKRVYPEPMLDVELPSCGRVSLLQQSGEQRYVAHLLYATPHYRGKLELIEDLLPLYNVPVKLRVPEVIKKATLIPYNTGLQLEQDGDSVKVLVPQFQMHCAVVFGY